MAAGKRANSYLLLVRGSCQCFLDLLRLIKVPCVAILAAILAGTRIATPRAHRSPVSTENTNDAPAQEEET